MTPLDDSANVTLAPVPATGTAFQLEGALAAWVQLRSDIAPLIGTAGFAALFRRSVHLAARDHPWLLPAHDAVLQDDFGSLRTAFATQLPADSGPGQAALSGTFNSLLGKLVGQSLAQDPAAGASDEDRLREANEHLAIAAINAQAGEATALDAHARQVAFLATVAHELRNPLMPLRLAAHMLDRARPDAAAHAKLQATIAGQVVQMTRLIGDLLEGSRLSTGNFRLERTLIDVCGVIERAIETCKPAMDARSHAFTSTIPAGPIRLLGDPVRLTQVFGNILENSSKYTPDGGAISLDAEVHGRTVVIGIRDNGIGISAKALPHVFDLFVRDAHAAAAHDGLGIGLAVVRELVRAHEGRVVASSRGLGQGSEIAVTLPLAVAHQQRAL